MSALKAADLEDTTAAGKELHHAANTVVIQRVIGATVLLSQHGELGDPRLQFFRALLKFVHEIVAGSGLSKPFSSDRQGHVVSRKFVHLDHRGSGRVR